MKYGNLLKTVCCVLVACAWLTMPGEVLAETSCKSFLLDIDVGSIGSSDAARTYQMYTDDIQDKFADDFDCPMDYQKRLKGTEAEKMEIDFYKLKRSFYTRREVELASYHFGDYGYDFVVGFQIVDNSYLKAIIFNVAKETIYEESRAIPDYAETGNLRKREFKYLMKRISREEITPGK